MFSRAMTPPAKTRSPADEEVGAFLAAMSQSGVTLEQFTTLRDALSDEAHAKLARMNVLVPREPAAVVALTEPDGR